MPITVSVFLTVQLLRSRFSLWSPTRPLPGCSLYKYKNLNNSLKCLVYHLQQHFNAYSHEASEPSQVIVGIFTLNATAVVFWNKFRSLKQNHIHKFFKHTAQRGFYFHNVFMPNNLIKFSFKDFSISKTCFFVMMVTPYFMPHKKSILI